MTTLDPNALDARLREIDALCEGIPRSPWVIAAQDGAPGRCFQAQVFGPNGQSLVCVESTDPSVEATRFAAFIAASPKIIRELRAMIDALRAELQRARAKYAAHCMHESRQHHSGGWTCPDCGAHGLPRT